MDAVRRSVSAVRARLTRRSARVFLFAVLVISSLPLVHAALTDVTTATREGVPEAPPTANHTVVTESARYGTLIAYAPNGTVTYYDNEHTKYFDVDPVEGESMTVEYVATDTLHTESPQCRDPPCTRNVVERANLSTGEVTEIYARYDYRETAAEWHDADRINDTHLVVADMVADQVFVVNTETEIIEWTWDAQSEFPVESGGGYPGDWAHLNDVEVLDDGTIMASLRNHDQVVFLDRETGLVEDWTLGSDDDHATVYEQHNPDYIPSDRGGPAVVVADSENGRIQEFQRVNGSERTDGSRASSNESDGAWTRTWEWSDRQLQWPRDADRLPNGNTLVTDTNGGRVLEVVPNGSVVWSVPLSHPYDAERLETGDESSGGRSAASLGLESQTHDADFDGHRYDLGIYRPLTDLVHALVPPRVTNAFIYVSPTWLGLPELGPAMGAVLAGVTWSVLEIAWVLRSRDVGVRSPLYRREE